MTASSKAAFDHRPMLYLVAGRPSGQPWVEFERTLRQALEGGVGILQMREKLLGPSEALEVGLLYRKLATEYGALFVVNDDAVLARDLDADGIHVGQDDLSPAEVRRIVGPDMLIGWSTHDEDQLLRARRTPEVDLIGVGPVNATSTKDAGAPVGIEMALKANEIFQRGPVFPIGGIDLDAARALRRAGIQRAAVASAVLGADHPREAAAGLLAALS